MDKQQEPRLRFKGFTGAWECKKLGEISTSYSGGTPIVGNAKFYGGTIPFIRSGEIHSSKTELFLTQEGLENSSTKLVKKGDILYALYGATSGEVGRSQIDGAINQAILAIIPKENYKAEFISQWLKINKENIVSLYLQGGQGNLSGEIVKKIEISFPSSKEQTHLGLFFRRLDSQIAESRAVLEKSRQLKKAMLAKMFPTNGEKIPKIRFKGFEGEWESRKLGEISDFAKGKGLSKSSIDSNGNTPCILYGELYTKYDCYINKVFSSTNEKIENPILTKSNDVLLPTSDVTPNGLAKACSIYFDDIVLGGDILVIRSTEMFGLFFAHYVESNPFMIIEKATGTTVFHIYEKDLRDIVLLLPSYEEQTAIGNFFRQLDETIALQSAEVERLNQLKKGLLAVMLV